MATEPSAGFETNPKTDPKEHTSRLQQATRSLLETVSGLTAATAAEASLLPGWSRGHVATHLARNADGMCNLLSWARTGQPTPMYASVERRDADIEAGAHRAPAELFTDVQESAERLASDIDGMPAEAWTREVQLINGSRFPAARVVWHRLKEVEIHHLDLAAGRTPADWPVAFAHQVLEEIIPSFARHADGWAVNLVATDTGTSYAVGQPAAPSSGTSGGSSGKTPTVRGSTQGLLAWLLGRGAVSDVRADDGDLPTPPRWA